MPSLVLIATCDKVISDASGPSLINVFAALDVHVPPQGLPPKALNPVPWAVFTFWRAADEDMGKSYVQQMRVYVPSGEQFGHNENKFTFTHRTHNIRSGVPSMPVGQEGNIKIVVWLEHEGKAATPQHEQSFSITHVKGEANEAKTKGV